MQHRAGWVVSCGAARSGAVQKLLSGCEMQVQGEWSCCNLQAHLEAGFPYQITANVVTGPNRQLADTSALCCQRSKHAAAYSAYDTSVSQSGGTESDQAPFANVADSRPCFCKAHVSVYGAVAEVSVAT